MKVNNKLIAKKLELLGLTSLTDKQSDNWEYNQIWVFSFKSLKQSGKTIEASKKWNFKTQPSVKEA